MRLYSLQLIHPKDDNNTFFLFKSLKELNSCIQEGKIQVKLPYLNVRSYYDNKYLKELPSLKSVSSGSIIYSNDEIIIRKYII